MHLFQNMCLILDALRAYGTEVVIEYHPPYVSQLPRSPSFLNCSHSRSHM